MKPEPPPPGLPDRAVAAAADAWLSEPRDTVAYQRLVQAVLDRRAWLQPALDEGEAGESPDQPELLDELGADAPPAAVGDLLAGEPAEVLEQLRRAPAQREQEA